METEHEVVLVVLGTCDDVELLVSVVVVVVVVVGAEKSQSRS